MVKLNLTVGFDPFNSIEDNLTFKTFKFPGGEIQFELTQPILNDTTIITCRLASSDDIILLCLAVDALRRNGIKKIKAFIPYFPYARQDRINNLGESLSLKVITDIINNLNLDTVYVFDPHSDVVIALLNNIEVITNSSFIQFVFNNNNINDNNTILVSPDAGAYKKIFKLAKNIYFKGNILTASKIRNTETGAIEKTEIQSNVPLDITKKYCIVDDICDGGRTFIELAKVLQERGIKDIILIVSHGIFSNGFGELKKYFTKIVSTDSIIATQYSYSFKDFFKLKA